MDIIEKYPEKPWKWEWISYNPNITMAIIEKYPEKPWKWNLISCNHFKLERKIFIENKLREYMAAYKIQQYWFSALDNPYNKIGKRKLERDYDKLLKLHIDTFN